MSEWTEGIGFIEVEKRMRLRSQVEIVVVFSGLEGSLELTSSLLECRLDADGCDFKALNDRTGHSYMKLS
jgi:hypothetical protein